jgi:NADPH-dependent ferric siderophore reductase
LDAVGQLTERLRPIVAVCLNTAFPAGRRPAARAPGPAHRHGEADAVKPLRRWARDRGLPAGDVRITGYWKRGEADYDG